MAVRLEAVLEGLHGCQSGSRCSFQLGFRGESQNLVKKSTGIELTDSMLDLDTRHLAAISR